MIYIVFWGFLFVLWGFNGSCILGGYELIIDKKSVNENIFKNIIFNFNIFDLLSITIFSYLIYKFLH